ncbi:hypothetical protein TNCT_717751 [Trichonephila clavata]|uniref:Uncharacterized protein n=1 Tax=Trichonephila clavata TaxID=2740835 RepID=A0A8X6IGI7_TRICU|nr:hypothetical protein TNCT_717751 [Trichonephila clavata]
MLDQTPGTSVWPLAITNGKSGTTVPRVLQDEALHQFHVQRVQLLQPDYHPRRVEFAQFVNQSATYMHFAISVLFCDEAAFLCEWVFNSHVVLKQPTRHPTTFRTTMLHC